MDAEDCDLGPFWAEAKRAYELECEHAIDLGSDAREPQTVDQLLELIESRGSNFEAFREKHSRLWSKLQRFAEPVVAVGAVTGEVFSNLDGFGGPVGSILKGITHLVSVSMPSYLISSRFRMGNVEQGLNTLFVDLLGCRTCNERI